MPSKTKDLLDKDFKNVTEEKSPPRKSGKKVADELDSLPKRKDNSVVWSGDEKTSRGKKG